MKRYLILLILIVLYACGGGGGSGSSNLPPPTVVNTVVNVDGGSGSVIGAPASITLTANPTALIIKGSSSITAAVKDITAGNVPDGTKVSFTLNDASLGTITAQATTFNGNAIATFTAKSIPGTAIITATAGSITKTVSITIAAAEVASIEYISATPQVIAISGTGATEVSNVIFAVKDITGAPISNGTKIDFTMNGPSGGKLPGAGGEYIGDVIDATPTQASGVTTGGQVTISLHSGKVAGPVTIIATVYGTTISTSTGTISIGGGLPSAKHFNLATTKFNLPGLVVSGVEAIETAYIADRFGNFDLLTVTSVSFYTEAGAIGRSGLTDATGLTSSTIRTQAPMPVDVAPLAAETTLLTYLNSTYGITVTGNPWDGWVTVLATVHGEESFDDLNANGLYDTGEPFTDLGEPFIDKNNDGCRNSGTQRNCNGTVTASTEPFEEYIDSNGNGQYDGPNGVWDGPNCPVSGCQTSKMIWTDITLAFTGNSAFCALSPSSSFALGSGGSRAFKFAVGDVNTNSLPSGTTIAVTLTGFAGATLSGTTSKTIADGLPFGPTEISFTLTNKTCTTCLATSPGTIDITVTPPAPLVGCTGTVSGTVLRD